MKKVDSMLSEMDIFLYKMYALNEKKNKNKLETLKEFLKKNGEGLKNFYTVRNKLYDKNL